MAKAGLIFIASKGGLLAATAYAFPPPRQYNFLKECYEAPPEQLSLDLAEPEEKWPDHVTLLATENGAQFFCSGFGLFLGRKSDRLAVKQKGVTLGEIPFFKLQDI